ncbi:MAG: polysaccharide deacetylase family protein [Candidatus Falkowbacteria bacterium]|nr:polysaccharide deacetylase family protein [Candidatus Falkowbacteria bacterium]
MREKIYLILIIIFLTVPLGPIFGAEKKNQGKKIPILMYHYIRDYSDINDPLGINLSVAPKIFSEQLDTIKKLGYKTINFQDVVNNNLPAKPIILTFDDGYEDFYTAAFPELRKRHMKAVTYVIASTINLPRYMTLEQIKVLAKSNIEIGGHTWSHPDLRFVNNKKLTWEISSSKKYLEDTLKKPIISFAYPSGKYDNRTIKEVKGAGYKFAVTTQNGLTDMSRSLTLTRLRIQNKTNLESFLK